VNDLEKALAVAGQRDEVYIARSDDPSGGWYNLYADRESDAPCDTVVEDVVLILVDLSDDHPGALADAGLSIAVYDKKSGELWS
jgi:hypothetical protein